MKIVFAGSPQFAVAPLEALIGAGAQIVAVITQPDKPFGRKKILTPTPVKSFAVSRGLPVYDFEKIRNCVDTVKGLGADIMITCAYGQILSQEVLDCFPQGVWNLHASLLPEFRGASPIQSAILAGNTHTGITVMKTELALDAGGILLVKRCEINGENYGELEDKLSALSAEAAVEALQLLQSGQTQLLIQDEAKATYCRKIQKADAKLDFCNSSGDICRLIRATTPSPGAYCTLNGEILNVFRAEQCDDCAGEAGEVCALLPKENCFVVKCGEGALKISEVQLAGGKRLPSRDFINGRKIKVGDRLD